jgi:hypothetical protein
MLGRDFTFWWRAARAVLEGLNPYDVIRPSGPYPFDGIFAYPLPAALVTIPLAGIDPAAGAAVFIGAGFALLTYGLLRLDTWRIAVLLSYCAYQATHSGQWAPLLLGAVLVPSTGFLLACKPTLGAALFLWRPSWRAFAGGVAIGLIGLAVQPTWPFDWLHTLQANATGGQYHAPLVMPGGFVLALALLRWRRPEARLLVAMACVPQNAFFYDQLPLLMVPASAPSLFAFSLWTHALHALAEWARPGLSYPDVADRSMSWEPFILWGMYVPCLLLVLRRSNAGPLPLWLDRQVTRLPVWLRGQAGLHEAQLSASTVSARGSGAGSAG